MKGSMRGLMRGSMRGLLYGAALAVALAGLGADASAAVTAEARASIAPVGGTPRAATMVLAKAAKKKKRSGAAAGSSKPDSGDAGSTDDDAGSKSSAASSGSSGDDPSKEDELLGGSAPKKKAEPPRDDSDASGGGGAGDSAKAPAAKPSGGDAESVSAKASPPDEPGAASSASALEFGVGARALFRNFNWTADGRAAMLGPYSLTPGPETGLWLEFYPAALGTTGFAANVGLFGSFNYGFGVATTLANGSNAPTTFRDFQGGLKVRMPLGTIVPNMSIAYGQQLFEIAQQQAMTDLPKLAYSFIRPGLGTRLQFPPAIALDIALGYLMVLDPGSGPDQVRSARFFPKTTAYGIDASVSVAYRLTGAIGARAGADFRQYGLTFSPDSTTRKVAGAVDRYIVAWAGIEVVLDGQGGAAGGADEPAKPSKRKHRRARDAKPDEESSDSGDSDSSSKSEKSEKSDDE
jgi:hypothetical protein